LERPAGFSWALGTGPSALGRTTWALAEPAWGLWVPGKQRGGKCSCFQHHFAQPCISHQLVVAPSKGKHRTV
jgi:hypothetical protein